LCVAVYFEQKKYSAVSDLKITIAPRAGEPNALLVSLGFLAMGLEFFPFAEELVLWVFCFLCWRFHLKNAEERDCASVSTVDFGSELLRLLKSPCDRFR